MGKKPSPGQVNALGEEVVELIPTLVEDDVVSLVKLSVAVAYFL